MIHENAADDTAIAPAYAGRFLRTPVPKHRLADTEASADAAYRLIHDELLMDGNS